MPTRKATWAIVIWTAFMAVAILAAALGLSNLGVGLAGGQLSACQGDAWARGGIGLMLLVILWLVVVAPLGLIWYASRPKQVG